jgi:hypothetical protein
MELVNFDTQVWERLSSDTTVFSSIEVLRVGGENGARGAVAETSS